MQHLEKPQNRPLAFDFMGYIGLSIITLGIYPLYFVSSRIHEANTLLFEIRDLLKEAADKE